MSVYSFPVEGGSQTKGQKISKANYGFLNSPKKQTKLTILSKEDAQDSEFRSFFGRIEETINCFRDLLTFSRREPNDKPNYSGQLLFKLAGKRA